MNMKSEYMPFDRTLDLIKHSFVKEVKDYNKQIIDFQHPSIRDLLIKILKSDPQIRMKYIAHLSSAGIASVIKSLDAAASSKEEESHSISITNDNELETLCTRLKQVIEASISADALEEMLSAIKHMMLTRALKLHKTDLIEFSRTKSGRVVITSLDSIRTRETYQTKSSYPNHRWIRIIEWYYLLVPFMMPYKQPEYLYDLGTRILQDDDYEDMINYLSILKENEPIVYKQLYSVDVRKYIEDCLENEIEACIDFGKEYVENVTYSDMKYQDLKDQFDEFAWKAETLLEIVNIYCSLDNRSMKRHSELQELFEDIEAPSEPDDDHDYEPYTPSPGNYWTIKRLFEDI